MKTTTAVKWAERAVGALTLTAVWSSSLCAQTQMGKELKGGPYEELGYSVAIDGNRLAVGLPNGGTCTGCVQVYEWKDTAWTQLGRDIHGEHCFDHFSSYPDSLKHLPVLSGKSSDWFGYSISLDGNRLAVGAVYNGGNGPRAGHVRVYEWKDGSWAQMGADIDGETFNNLSGHSVSLDGDRVAIGAPRNSDGGMDAAGHVRVYQWTGTAWAQLGQDIDGAAAGIQSGWSVSLDGDRLAVGAPYNSWKGKYAGQVRVYEWTGEAWAQLGQTIEGEAAGDWSGSAVSLDGNRLAIGAESNSGGAPYAGHVRVYQWTGTAWTQLGQAIEGEAAGDRLGHSVSLDGNRLAAGAPYNSEGAGHVRVYAWDGGAWRQLGTDIDGKAAGDRSGYAVSLDGDKVAIGARHNHEDSKWEGYVRVYRLDGRHLTGSLADSLPDSSTDVQGAERGGELGGAGTRAADSSSGTAHALSSAIRVLESDFGQALRVYPNPTEGAITIDLGARQAAVELVLTTAGGKQVATQTYAKVEKITYSLAQPPGVYVVAIASAGKRALVRLVKQ